MDISKKPIFTEGEYFVANSNTNGAKRGVIGMVDRIICAEDEDQCMEIIIPYYGTDSGERKLLRRRCSTWGKYLEHLPDRAADNMDIAEINTQIMFGIKHPAKGSIEEYLHRNQIIRETSTFRLVEELKSRNDFTELEPVKIIFNAPATIVFWNDDTKTVVKCSKGQEFSEYYGYLAAMAKKMYGTNGTINRLIKDKREYGDNHFNPEPLEKVMPRKSLDISVDDTIANPIKKFAEDMEKAAKAVGSMDIPRLSPRGDEDGDGFILRYDYDPKIGFDIEFNKRRKANDFYNIVEWSIKSGNGRYTLEELLNKKNEDGIETTMFRDYGWDSMDGIWVQKLAPDRWKVIFPPAKFFGKH